MVATVRAVHALNCGEFHVPQLTSVSLLRRSLVDAFNVSPTALAFVNGQRVVEPYYLRHHDIVEFVVPWGRKGADFIRLPLTQHGTIDITDGLPDGLVHVDVRRLGPTCKRIGIEYGKAIVDWTEFGRKYRKQRYPMFSGVVIKQTDHALLMAALDEKKQKRQRKVDRLSVLAALFTLNRRAKRCRDLAQSYYEKGMHGFAGDMKREKERIYSLKEQVIHHLVETGILVGGKYHRFDFGNWAEILEGQGYRFHRPCPPREPGEGDLIESIEAKPKEEGEPTVEIAYEVVQNFLIGKERVAVYQWPPKARPPRYRWRDEEDDDWDDDFEDEFGE